MEVALRFVLAIKSFKTAAVLTNNIKVGLQTSLGL